MSDVAAHDARVAAMKGKLGNNHIKNNGVGTRPELQKLERNNPRKKRAAIDADHQARLPETDERHSGQFNIAATLHISDERNRDNDGAYTTLQDCLIAAIGRLSKMDTVALRSYAACLKRK